MSASKSFRSFSMPLGMVVGALFCRQIVWVDAALQGLLTPVFIFTMLFLVVAFPDSGLAWRLLCFGVYGCGACAGRYDMRLGARCNGGRCYWRYAGR